MKAYVYVSLKKSVLDPQGKTIHGALKKMGYRGVNDLRQGKYFEIALDDGIDREDSASRGRADRARSADQSGDRGISLHSRNTSGRIRRDNGIVALVHGCVS